MPGKSITRYHVQFIHQFLWITIAIALSCRHVVIFYRASVWSEMISNSRGMRYINFFDYHVVGNLIMKQYFLGLLVAIALLMQPVLVLAVDVPDLNQVVLTVPDRSPTALSNAINKAFSQVLIKLSGNPQVMTLPAIQNALPDLQQWVKSYAYESQTSPEGIVTLQLTVAFDESSLTQLLREAGQASWSANRPLTLVYFDGDADDWQADVAKLAKDRGIPVIFPEMDLSDQMIMGDPAQTQEADQSADVSDQQIKEISSRYGVSSMMTIQIHQQADNAWTADGQYWLNGQSTPWHIVSSTKQGVVTNLLNKMAAMMMSRLVVSDNEALKSTVTLSVTGVNDIADYAKVMHYLRGREDVTDVSVKDVTTTGVIFSVHITGDIPQFKKVLASGDRLHEVNTDLVENEHHADLYYFW